MNNTFIEAVAIGIVPAMNNRMIKATFEYSGDSKLTLEGDALQSWLAGYIQMIGAYAESQATPTMTSDALRNAIRQRRTQANNTQE